MHVTLSMFVIVGTVNFESLSSFQMWQYLRLQLETQDYDWTHLLMYFENSKKKNGTDSEKLHTAYMFCMTYE